jgi:hypothetical protein
MNGSPRAALSLRKPPVRECCRRRAIGLSIPALLLAGALTALSGCGQSHARAQAAITTSSTTQSSSSPNAKAPSDNDNDGDNGADDINWGRAATPAEKRAVTAVVKAFYRAGMAKDGARACKQMYSLFAEEVPEVYGEPPGAPELRGSTCAAVMTKVFELHRRELLADAPVLEVTRVRIKRLRALAFLRTPGAARDIPVHSEHGEWKVDALFDSGLG